MSDQTEAEIRNAALEEAAQMLDCLHNEYHQDYTAIRQGANAVRSLKSAPAAAQPAASAEPSDMAHEIWAAAQLAPGEGIVDGAARVGALLSRYGRPAGDAQPVAWVAADTLNSPHPGCVSSLAYMSQLDRDRGREYVPLYAAGDAGIETKEQS